MSNPAGWSVPACRNLSLEERIAVLERIATDANSSSVRLADEIERLRIEKDPA